MKKTVYVMPLLVLIIVSLCIYYVKVNEGEKQLETTLEKAFENSGAELVSSEVYFWAPVMDNYGSVEHLYPIIDDIMLSIGVVKDNRFKQLSMENDEIKKMEINGITDDERVVDILVHISKPLKVNNMDYNFASYMNSMKGAQKSPGDLFQTSKNVNDSGERYISVNVVQDMALDKLEETKRDIVHIFQKYDVEPKVNACITGTFEGNLDYQELNEVAKRVLKQAEARKVEGMRDKNYISVSAYTPYMENYIKVNGKKINLNFACRYNSYEDKTYIWLATPVITTEY